VDFLTSEGEFPESSTTIWTNGVALRDNYAYATVGYEGLRNVYVSPDFSTINEDGSLATTDPQGVDVQGE